jgi:hypothetical protein
MPSQKETSPTMTWPWRERDRPLDPAPVVAAEEPELVVVIAAHHREVGDVGLTTLDGVNGVDLDLQ